MKAKELMIGDWVRCQYTPFQVEGIEHRNKRYTVTGDGFNTNVAGVHPIPLTAEILEKNGFNQVIDLCKIHTYHERKNGINIVMFSTPETTIFSQKSILIKSIKTKYVHELQHILRLCGIEKEIKL